MFSWKFSSLRSSVYAGTYILRLGCFKLRSCVPCIWRLFLTAKIRNEVKQSFSRENEVLCVVVIRVTSLRIWIGTSNTLLFHASRIKRAIRQLKVVLLSFLVQNVQAAVHVFALVEQCAWFTKWMSYDFHTTFQCNSTLIHHTDQIRAYLHLYSWPIGEAIQRSLLSRTQVSL